jgi:hypothetical protein
VKLNPHLIERLRQALGSVADPFLHVSDIEVCAGASPYARCPAVICHVGTSGKGRPVEKILKSLRSRFPAHLPNIAAPRAKGGAEAAVQIAAALAGTPSSASGSASILPPARAVPRQVLPAGWNIFPQLRTIRRP